ncbi:ribosomal RNA large subunit methyltransferase H [Gemmatimonadetes bacterium T265]|nr:ribosomal RNA large subunit methyltransferase H [Gemmatimonadetes bacterium T265]
MYVIAVGRARGALAEAAADYERRAAHYWALHTVEVREESARSLPRDRVVAREGERLAARVPAGAALVACDERGESWTSSRFATWLSAQRDAARDVAFVLGGALGLAPALRDRAAARLALAPWTLPHDLARVVLAEQLYRAGTLVRGEPYHK